MELFRFWGVNLHSKVTSLFVYNKYLFGRFLIIQSLRVFGFIIGLIFNFFLYDGLKNSIFVGMVARYFFFLYMLGFYGFFCIVGMCSWNKSIIILRKLIYNASHFLLYLLADEGEEYTIFCINILGLFSLIYFFSVISFCIFNLLGVWYSIAGVVLIFFLFL